MCQGGICLTTLFRKYNDRDQMKICKFFETLHDYDSTVYGNLKVMWECMLQYPSYPLFHHEENGIWEVEDKIVGVVHLSGPWFGEVNIDLHPKYMDLYEEMLSYAEKRFAGTNRQGQRYIRTSADKSWRNVNDLLEKLNYERCGDGKLFSLDVSTTIKNAKLDRAFEVRTLDEVYNFNKLNRLLWKALNYAGEPPAYDDDVYLPIKHAWFAYEQELCTVVLAPDGSYAGFCGLWYDECTKVAYIEPLVRDEQYKDMGIGRTLIYETLEKCKQLGAETIFTVPNEMSINFYKRIGFKQKSNQNYWIKKWNT